VPDPAVVNRRDGRQVCLFSSLKTDRETDRDGQSLMWSVASWRLQAYHGTS